MLTDSDMAELREAFFQQAGEILDNLNGYIMAIEKYPEEDNWKRLKRAFHTLKGTRRPWDITVSALLRIV